MKRQGGKHLNRQSWITQLLQPVEQQEEAAQGRKDPNMQKTSSVPQ